MSSPKPSLLAALAALGTGVTASPAPANEVVYRCQAQPPVTVVDGGPLDEDPVPDRIRTQIDCLVDDGGGNVWRAQGVIVAHADDPDHPVTSVPELTIWNQSGNILAQALKIEHRYPPPPASSTDLGASIAGHFDNLNAPGTLGGAILTWDIWTVYGSALQTQTLLNGATPYVMAPAAFADTGLLYTLPQPHEHHAQLLFYLDTPGDAIIMTAGDGIDVATAAALCPEDLDGSGDVSIGDLLLVLGAWGPCGGCPEDLDGSGDVGVADMLQVLGAWGLCP